MFTFISLRLKKELSLFSSDLPLEKRGMPYSHSQWLPLSDQKCGRYRRFSSWTILALSPFFF